MSKALLKNGDGTQPLEDVKREGKFYCEQCQYSTNSQVGFQEHMNDHVNESSWGWKYQQLKTFADIQDMKTGAFYQCIHCKVSSNSENVFLGHINNHIREALWVWKYFTKSTRDKKSRRRIVEQMTCSFCDQDIECQGIAAIAHLKQHNVDQTTIENSQNTKEEYLDVSVHSVAEDPEKDIQMTPSTHRTSGRSWVWGFFKKVSNASAECGFCKKPIKCHGSSTSGMASHLKRHGLTPTIQRTPIFQSDEENEEVVRSSRKTVTLPSSVSLDVKFKRSELKEPERCFVCNNTLGALRNQLSGILGFTNTAVYEVLESFIGVDLSEDLIKFSGVCQDCFISLEKFDEYQQLSQEIQNRITDLYQKTQSEPIFFEEPMDEEMIDSSMDLSCQKCNKTFPSMQEMSAHTHSVGLRKTSEVSTSFQKIAEDEGFQYDLEAFQKAFGCKDHEYSHADLSKSSSLAKKPLYENMEQVNPCIFESLRAEGIDYNLSAFRKAFGSSRDNATDKKQQQKTNPQSELEAMKKNGIYYCDQCKYNTINQKEFQGHINDHQALAKGLQCDICQKICKNNVNMDIHMILEHGGTNGPFECPVCFKTFTEKLAFRSHYYIHKLQRDLLCLTCGARFAQRTSFKMHMMIHENIRPFGCEFEGCDKSFRTAGKQKAHHRVHTGEKIFECPYCPGKKFAQSYGRDLHIKNFHRTEGSLSEICTICSIKIDTKEKMKLHLKYAHDVVETEENSSEDSS